MRGRINHYVYWMLSNHELKNKQNPAEFTNCIWKSAEQHMAAVITRQLLPHNCWQLWFGISLSRSVIHFSSSSIDRDGMCSLHPGGGWLERDAGGGGSLMGKGTMVCGDTFMFNHKWPPHAGSHKPAPLLITAALKGVHCNVFWAPLYTPHPQPQSNPFVRGCWLRWDDSVTWGQKQNP